jgi:hypothetical protein
MFAHRPATLVCGLPVKPLIKTITLYQQNASISLDKIA